MPGSRRCFLIALGALLLAVGAAADARAAMVTVSVDGPGSVRVRASEPGAPVLDAVCATSSSTPALRGGRTCYFHVFPGLGAAIDVRLDAEPLGDQGQRFLRWAPPECSGTDPTCTYALPRSDQSMRVRALFTDVQAPTVTIRSPPADDQLFVSEDGSFAGAVGSSDPDAPPSATSTACRRPTARRSGCPITCGPGRRHTSCAPGPVTRRATSGRSSAPSASSSRLG